MNPNEVAFIQYQDNLIKNKEIYLQEYKKVSAEVAKSPAQYKGQPVDFLLQAMFFSPQDMERLRNLTGRLMRILNKTIDFYLENENFRQNFAFSPRLEKMILKDPGYKRYIPMARFDVFYHCNGNFQFCELNTDGSSGMVRARELERIIGESSVLADLKREYEFTGFEIIDTWVTALLENYKEFSKSNKKPQIAIIDFFSSGIPSEFVEFKKAFENRGCPTIVVDIRDLKYKNGKLYYEDFLIDCIYRRAVTGEIDENCDRVKDFTDAYLDGAVCVVGSLRSQIAHNKNIFSILHNPEKTFFLSQEERKFIEDHIPYTRNFDAGKREMIEFTTSNREKLVLKPADKYAARGVYIGRDYSQEAWKVLVEGIKEKDYLLQEFCHVPKKPMAMFIDGDITFVDNNYTLGLFLYNEELKGIYTRAGRQNIIGSNVESFIVPNFIVEKKP